VFSRTIAGMAIRARQLPFPFDRLVRVRLPLDAFIVAAIVLVAVRFLDVQPWNDSSLDFYTYWGTRGGIHYGLSNPFTIGAYLYAPAFAQAIAPLTALPWPVFAGLWTALIVAAYLWLVGRWAFPILFSVVVALELYLGQIDIFLAAAIVLGFRYPAAWAFPLLTKLTPGIGLLWFAFRREWMKLFVAVSATLVIVGASAIVDPAAWRGWFDLLYRSATHPHTIIGTFLPIPLWVRLPIAVAVIAWGARTDRPWTVPVGALLAMPVLWVNTFAILVAVVPLLREAGPVPARRWLVELGGLGSTRGTRLAAGER
jgi:hypothetical protein